MAKERTELAKQKIAEHHEKHSRKREERLQKNRDVEDGLLRCKREERLERQRREEIELTKKERAAEEKKRELDEKRREIEATERIELVREHGEEKVLEMEAKKLELDLERREVMILPDCMDDDFIKRQCDSYVKNHLDSPSGAASAASGKEPSKMAEDEMREHFTEYLHQAHTRIRDLPFYTEHGPVGMRDAGDPYGPVVTSYDVYALIENIDEDLRTLQRSVLAHGSSEFNGAHQINLPYPPGAIKPAQFAEFCRIIDPSGAILTLGRDVAFQPLHLRQDGAAEHQPMLIFSTHQRIIVNAHPKKKDEWVRRPRPALLLQGDYDEMRWLMPIVVEEQIHEENSNFRV